MQFVQRVGIAYIRTKFKFLSAISKKKAAKEAFALFCTPQSRNSRLLPPLFKEAEKLDFAFQQYRITGFRWNRGGNRRALVLHGFESSVVNFESYIAPLISKGYEVLAFDAPAHGQSSGKKVNALIYRDLIKHIHQHYGPVQSYLSHSFGGLALALALAEIPHDGQYRAAFIAPATETATALDQFFGFIGVTDKKVKEEFENLIIDLTSHPISWFSIHRALNTIQARILWLHDEGDRTTPLADALKIKNENRPTIQFVITKGLGHSRIYRDAEVISAVTAFI